MNNRLFSYSKYTYEEMIEKIMLDNARDIPENTYGWIKYYDKIRNQVFYKRTKRTWYGRLLINSINYTYEEMFREIINDKNKDEIRLAEIRSQTIDVSPRIPVPDWSIHGESIDYHHS